MSRACITLFLLPITGLVLCGMNVLFGAETSSSATIEIVGVRGPADFRQGTTQWTPVKTGRTLTQGAAIRTGTGGAIDFLLKDSGTSLCLPEKSELHFERVSSDRAGEMVVSDTRLRLTEGTLVGSQRKLAPLNRFEILTPKSKATIVGTEYVVRADGAVSVLSGSVTMIYNEPGGGGSVKVTVQAGQSFDPATGMVVDTTPDYLEDLIADIDTVRHNAEVYKLDNATVIVKPEKFMSPTKGH